MEIKINFGIYFELERVMNTINRLDWYKENGYKVRLPKGITKKSSEDKIEIQIKEEFNKEEFSEISTKIFTDLIKRELDFIEKISEVFKESVPKEIIIYLTNYGADSSYDLPNKIAYNINKKVGWKMIVHDIIDLLLVEKIKKYKVERWEKERIVDMVLNSKEFKFLKYNHWQKDYEGTNLYIDDLFNKYFFSDNQYFFSKIEEARINFAKL